MSLNIVPILLIITFTNLNAQTMQYIRTKAEIRGKITEQTTIPSHIKPVSDTYFRIVSGNVYKGQQPIAIFTTDDKGHLFFELPIGTYCIVEDDRPETFKKKRNTSTETWDNKCLYTRWQRPLTVIDVKSLDPIEINFVNLPFNPQDPSCKK